jgi:hypothetical protein
LERRVFVGGKTATEDCRRVRRVIAGFFGLLMLCFKKNKKCIEIKLILNKLNELKLSFLKVHLKKALCFWFSKYHCLESINSTIASISNSTFYPVTAETSI